MGKRSAKASPAYAERIAARKRLRAVVGWDVRLRDLSPEQLRQAQERAAEPVQRVSLDALAAGAELQSRAETSPAPPPLLVLAFEARFREGLTRGAKTSTIRKRSSHTARYTVGRRVQIEAPRGKPIGPSEIVAVDERPNLSPAEREALKRIYGPRCNGPWVRLRFEPPAK